MQIIICKIVSIGLRIFCNKLNTKYRVFVVHTYLHVLMQLLMHYATFKLTAADYGRAIFFAIEMFT